MTLTCIIQECHKAALQYSNQFSVKSESKAKIYNEYFAELFTNKIMSVNCTKYKFVTTKKIHRQI